MGMDSELSHCQARLPPNRARPHTVVFGGFSSNAPSPHSRLPGHCCHHAGWKFTGAAPKSNFLPLSKKPSSRPTVKSVVIYKRTGTRSIFSRARFMVARTLMAKASDVCPRAPRRRASSLYPLLRHHANQKAWSTPPAECLAPISTTNGYSTLKEEDTYWCTTTSDGSPATATSSTNGPPAERSYQPEYEGAPNHPDPTVLVIIGANKVNIFRQRRLRQFAHLLRWGREWPKKNTNEQPSLMSASGRAHHPKPGCGIAK